MKTSGKIHLLTVIVGVITAVVIVLTQLFYFELSTPIKLNTETEQESSASGHQGEVISMPSSYSLPSSTSVLLEHEFSIIEEILFDGEKAYSLPLALPLASGKLFRALFQFIISPNAP
jgi:hypothetical protein